MRKATIHTVTKRYDPKKIVKQYMKWTQVSQLAFLYKINFK